MINFIAEISSNHHRDLQRSIKFIDAASQAGCSAVKFQLFRIDKLFAVGALPDKEVARRKNWELPIDFIPKLALRCREVGIEFSCTPFYLDAVAELEPYVDFYKIDDETYLMDF